MIRSYSSFHMFYICSFTCFCLGTLIPKTFQRDFSLFLSLYRSPSALRAAYFCDGQEKRRKGETARSPPFVHICTLDPRQTVVGPLRLSREAEFSLPLSLLHPPLSFLPPVLEVREACVRSVPSYLSSRSSSHARALSRIHRPRLLARVLEVTAFSCAGWCRGIVDFAILAHATFFSRSIYKRDHFGRPHFLSHCKQKDLHIHNRAVQIAKFVCLKSIIFFVQKYLKLYITF